ncbi:hypothetical protein RQP46_009160 [Phenoliferia psychrophenolica]
MSSSVQVKAEPTGKSKAARAAPDDGDSGSAPRKRARKDDAPAVATPDADQADEPQPNEVEEEEEEDGDADPGERPALIRDAKGFVAGSIVRIAAENFVTYDKVEFTPGPYLNMVLGPNGSGKSTIACAIALGLGFSPKVLGRSKELREFVKRETQECQIEIELKGLPGKPNAIIRRFIYMDKDTKSRFTLNGVSATAKEVSAKMEELHVQINNLCTFLPQDRVASFSAMSSPELLVETQKAAGDSRLSGWHQTLITERESQSEHEASLALNRRQLDFRVGKNADEACDVLRYEDRQQLQFELAVLSLLIPMAEYNAAWEEFDESKALKKDVREQLDALVAANKPFEESQTLLEHMVGDLEQDAKKYTSRANKANKEASEKKKSFDKCGKDGQKTRDEHLDLANDSKHRRKAIKKLTREIGELENALGDRPDPPNYTEIKAQTKALTVERGKLDSETSDLDGQVERHKQDISSIDKELKVINAEYESVSPHFLAQPLTSLHLTFHSGFRLQGVDKQKFYNLQKDEANSKSESQTAAAVLWMREEKKKGNFKGNVYEPPRLTVSLKECKDVNKKKHWATLAEGPINMAHFKTFIYEEQADYDYMMRALNDKTDPKKSYRINGHQLGKGELTRSAFRDAYSPEQACFTSCITLAPHAYSGLHLKQLHQWGFDCLAIDLIEGPEAVLAFLCKVANLHRIPVSFNDKVNAEAIERSGLVRRYLTPDGSHSINQSKYGARNSVVEMRYLGKVKIFGPGAVTEKLEELKKRKAEVLARRATLEKKLAESVRLHTIGRDKMDKIERKKVGLNKERKALNVPLDKWIKSLQNLGNKRRRVKTEQDKPSIESKKKKLLAAAKTITERRVRFALEHKDLLMAAASAQIESIDFQLRRGQAQSDLRAMKHSADENDQELSEKQAEFDEIVTETSRLRNLARDLQKLSLDCIATADEAPREEFEKRCQIENPDLKTLSAKNLQLEVELGGLAVVTAEFVDKYEKRKLEIIEFEAKVATDQANLDRSTALLKKVEAEWLPKLEHLVEKVSLKFSAAFTTLGLLGEVRIAKHTDYNKWGIEILVSFRDQEALQVLTQHRQSGGERALATATYLLALSSLARAPFTLVDEIDQGMDVRVERSMHNAIVKTTCEGDVGQYFLITPKLLPNLNYHPKMKILIIQNGKWLPESLSLEDVVAKRLEAKRVALA